MRMRGCIVLLVASALSPASANETLKLPAEVTPTLRAACEQDVRRHCIGENPTYEMVKRCVLQKFTQFGTRCRIAIASSGLVR